MPLSEHEQRLLEQMERALYAEDPRFAATIRDTAQRAGTRRSAGIGILIASIGVAVIIGGLLSATPWLGVLGFVAVLGGTYVAIRGVSSDGPAAATDVTDGSTPPPPQPRRKSGFLKGAEERFERRRDNDQP